MAMATRTRLTRAQSTICSTWTSQRPDSCGSRSAAPSTAKAGSSDYYPCDIPPGRDTCGDSTFENETSDGSPLVEDYLAIIKNIQESSSTDYTTLVVCKNQREVGSHGTCALGVEAPGGQDVIGIIKESVKRFASNGKVGGKGNMDCDGNIKGQPVLVDVERIPATESMTCEVLSFGVRANFVRRRTQIGRVWNNEF